MESKLTVCAADNCENIAHYSPIVIVWGKKDLQRDKTDAEGNPLRATVFLDRPVCYSHATTNVSDFSVGGDAKADLVATLGDEPDMENIIIQYLGNEKIPWDVTREHLKSGTPVSKLMRAIRKESAEVQTLTPGDVGVLAAGNLE